MQNKFLYFISGTGLLFLILGALSFTISGQFHIFGYFVAIMFLMVIGLMFFASFRKNIKQKTGASDQKQSFWPPSIGAQVALVWIIIGVVAILINPGGFKTNVWEQTNARLVFFAIIVLGLSYVLNLGRKPNPSPPRFFRDALIILLVIYVIACGFFGWDGRLKSLMKLGGDETKAVESSQVQTTINQINSGLVPNIPDTMTIDNPGKIVVDDWTTIDVDLYEGLSLVFLTKNVQIKKRYIDRFGHYQEGYPKTENRQQGIWWRMTFKKPGDPLTRLQLKSLGGPTTVLFWKN